jgi:hypothetical protein
MKAQFPSATHRRRVESSYVKISTVRFRTPSVTKSPQARLNE